ncbi:hypothetical protein VNI00_017578, partial [Paramarasmius palmivorus]
SAGADPGLTCYRKNGPLVVTDANLLLGRLLPDYFPKIFGLSEKEPLDIDASRTAFEKVVKEVNDSYGSAEGDVNAKKEWSFDEVVYGFIKVANETMCRLIRALTEARGYATGQHVLASFGGAGGQHACEIAKLLGIHTILIHRYSSVLSAYGLALADRAHEIQAPSSTFYTANNKPELISRLDKLEAEVREELRKQGFEGTRVRVERMLNMRFEGTDTALMVLPEGDEKVGEEGEDFLKAFRRTYKNEFGFLLEGKTIVVDDIKVRGIGKTFDSLGETVFSEMDRLRESDAIKPAAKEKIDSRHSVYFDRIGRVDDTPVYLLDKLDIGEQVHGPAIVIDDTQTIVVVPGAKAVLGRKHLVIELD